MVSSDKQIGKKNENKFKIVGIVESKISKSGVVKKTSHRKYYLTSMIEMCVQKMETCNNIIGLKFIQLAKPIIMQRRSGRTMNSLKGTIAITQLYKRGKE